MEKGKEEYEKEIRGLLEKMSYEDIEEIVKLLKKEETKAREEIQKILKQKIEILEKFLKESSVKKNFKNSKNNSSISV